MELAPSASGMVPAASFVSEYIKLGSGQTACSNLPTEKLSVSIWVKVTMHRKRDGFVGCFQENSGGSAGWVLGTDGNHANFNFRVGLKNKIDPDQFQRDVWYHLAATYDGAEMRIFVNGVAKGNPQNHSGIISYPSTITTEFVVGAYRNADEVYQMWGSLSRLSIWNRALNISEINALYNASSTVCGPTEYAIRGVHVGLSPADERVCEVEVQVGGVVSGTPKTFTYNAINPQVLPICVCDSRSERAPLTSITATSPQSRCLCEACGWKELRFLDAPALPAFTSHSAQNPSWRLIETPFLDSARSYCCLCCALTSDELTVLLPVLGPDLWTSKRRLRL